MSTMDSTPTSDHRSQQPRTRRKSREVASRYLSPTSSSSSLSPNNAAANNNAYAVSPVGRYPVFEPKYSAAATKPLWPKVSSASTGSKKIETLAEHLANLRLKDLLSDTRDDRLNPEHEFQTEPRFLSRQKSCSETEISRFETSKENHKPVLGKLKSKVNKSLSSSSSALASGSRILPGRLSVDENVLNRSRKSHSFVTNRNESSPLVLSESDRCSDAERCASYDSDSSAAGVRKTASFSSYMSSTATTSTSLRSNSGVHVSSKFMPDSATSSSRLSSVNVSKTEDSPKQMHRSILKRAMRRANSLTGHGSVTSQWALSPGRISSSIVSVENKGKLLKTYSNLKAPTSPKKSAKGVEKLLNLGMDLFKTKKFTSSSLVLSVGSANAESAHKLRLLHCRLMQWRFANVKAQTACENVTKQAEMNLICAQQSLVRLHHSVTQKRLEYQRECLLWKLNVILHSQMKLLETWGEIERQHTSAVSMTKDSLLAAVCKVPLVDGAKVDTQLASLTLLQASDLTASIASMLTALPPLSGETSVLLSKLADVVAEEKFLIEECFEMCRNISLLEVKEWSLRSTLIQLA